jgi:hypothetical protein
MSSTPSTEQRYHTSSTPRISATSTHHSSEHFLPFVSLMNQSTIYRRHEARLARSYALRDDPRPAFLRVLSGLPVTRIIIPPYQPKGSTTSTDVTIRNANHINNGQHRLGDYSEETVFSAVDDHQNVANNDQCKYMMSSQNTALQQALQAMLAAGGGAAMGEFLFGGHYQKRTPLFHRRPPIHPDIFLRGHAAAATADSSIGFQLLRSHHQARSTAMTATAAASKPSALILLAASTTSLLFGTKVLTTQYLSLNGDANTATSILSSALAGGVAGMATLATAVQRTRAVPPPWTSTTHISPSSLLGRHVVAATLYFATFDAFCYSIDSNNTESSSTPRIIAAGAAAGAVQASILHSSQGSLHMAKTAVRAVPIHALVFSAYECIRQGMNVQ